MSFNQTALKRWEHREYLLTWLNGQTDHRLLLLLEALAVMGVAAACRHKIPFFMELGASVINVVAQIAVLIQVYDIYCWYIILGTGQAQGQPLPNTQSLF